ncbi:hypothetical protein HN766_07130 [Candidatus Poribacteria bacterium]|nr:hypothetical protein [Candidatus Poribacteria bacterium]
MYLNGALVATFGVVADTAAEEQPEFADRLTRKYVAAPMAPQAVQILAIRHSNASGQTLQHRDERLGTVTGVAVQVFGGTPNDGVAAYVALVHGLARHRTFQVVASCVFAFLHLLLFAFYPKLTENLHFAVFAAAYALAMGLAMPVYGSPSTPTGTLVVHGAFQSAFALASTAGCHFLYRLLAAHKTKWARAVMLYGALAVAIAWALPTLAAFAVSFALFFEMLRLSVRTLARRQERVWIAGAGTLVFAGSAIGAVTLDTAMDLNSFEPIAVIADLGLLALMGSMSVYLSQGFARTHRSLEARTADLEQLNVELEDRVDERTAQLASANSDLEVRNQFIQRVFGRYLSEEIVDNLLESPEALQVGGEKRTITILMSDLRGFSTLSEQIQPEQVVTLLNNYLGAMTDIIVAHDGTIDEFIGDAILVFFGAPIVRANDCQRAVACALEMQRAMDGVNAWNRDNGLPEIGMGIAINTGDVVVGNIGSLKRAKYAAVGAQVNLTSRIQSHAAIGEIVVTERVLAAAAGKARVAGQETVTPKGVRDPVGIYRIEAESGPV